MSIPRSVAEILNEHVTLEIEGIDRMYLNVYVPRLQREAGVAGFFRFHRGASCKTPIACLIISRREAKAEDAGGHFWHDVVLNAIIITPAKWMLPDKN